MRVEGSKSFVFFFFVNLERPVPVIIVLCIYFLTAKSILFSSCARSTFHKSCAMTNFWDAHTLGDVTKGTHQRPYEYTLRCGDLSE